MSSVFRMSRHNSAPYRNAQPVERVSEEYLVPYINELDKNENTLCAPRLLSPRITNHQWQVSCQDTQPNKPGSIWVDENTGEMYVRTGDAWKEI